MKKIFLTMHSTFVYLGLRRRHNYLKSQDTVLLLRGFTVLAKCLHVPLSVMTPFSIKEMGENNNDQATQEISFLPFVVVISGMKKGIG